MNRTGRIEHQTAAFQGVQSSITRLLGVLSTGDACPYPFHRPTDWRVGDGPIVCGICHPPAIGLVGVLIVGARAA